MNTLTTLEDYQNAPVGTRIECKVCDSCGFIKLGDGAWKHERDGNIHDSEKFNDTRKVLFWPEPKRGDRVLVELTWPDITPADWVVKAVTKKAVEEPKGLGAVVEDSEGRKYIRGDDSSWPWYCKDRSEDWYGWVAIDSPTVLSEGYVL